MSKVITVQEASQTATICVPDRCNAEWWVSYRTNAHGYITIEHGLFGSIYTPMLKRCYIGYSLAESLSMFADELADQDRPYDRACKEEEAT